MPTETESFTDAETTGDFPVQESEAPESAERYEFPEHEALAQEAPDVLEVGALTIEAQPRDPVLDEIISYRGGEPEEWKNVYEGSGFTFNGKEILDENGAVWDKFDASTMQEVTRQWVEGGSLVFVDEIQKTAPDGGVEFYVTHLIISDDRQGLSFRIDMTETPGHQDEEGLGPQHDAEVPAHQVNLFGPEAEQLTEERPAESPLYGEAVATAGAERTETTTLGTTESMPVAMEAGISDVRAHTPDAAEVSHSEHAEQVSLPLQPPEHLPELSLSDIRETPAAPRTEEHDPGVRSAVEIRSVPHTGMLREASARAESLPLFERTGTPEDASVRAPEQGRADVGQESPVIGRLHEAGLFAIIETPREDSTPVTEAGRPFIELTSKPDVPVPAEIVRASRQESAEARVSAIVGNTAMRTEDVGSIEHFLKEEPLELSLSDLRDVVPESHEHSPVHAERDVTVGQNPGPAHLPKNGANSSGSVEMSAIPHRSETGTGTTLQAPIEGDRAAEHIVRSGPEREHGIAPHEVPRAEAPAMATYPLMRPTHMEKILPRNEDNYVVTRETVLRPTFEKRGQEMSWEERKRATVEEMLSRILGAQAKAGRTPENSERAYSEALSRLRSTPLSVTDIETEHSNDNVPELNGITLRMPKAA